MLFSSSRLYGVVFCPLLQPCISPLNCCIIFIVVLLRMLYSLSLVTPFSVLNLSSRPVKGSSSFCVGEHSLSSLDNLFHEAATWQVLLLWSGPALLPPSLVHHWSSIREVCICQDSGIASSVKYLKLRPQVTLMVAVFSFPKLCLCSFFDD